MRIVEILHRKGRKIHKVVSSATILAAARSLTLNGVGCLLVYDRWGHYVGILSERDLVHGLAQFGEEALQTPVSEVMTPDLITCLPNDRVKDALRVMTVHRIRHLPVRGDGEFIGIVSIGDLVGALLEEK